MGAFALERFVSTCMCVRPIKPAKLSGTCAFKARGRHLATNERHKSNASRNSCAAFLHRFSRFLHMRRGCAVDLYQQRARVQTRTHGQGCRL